MDVHAHTHIHVKRKITVLIPFSEMWVSVLLEIKRYSQFVSCITTLKVPV